MGAKSNLWCWWARGIAGLCGMFLAGCAPLADVVKISVVEPLEYTRRINDCVDKKRNSKLAEDAWAEFLFTSQPAFAASGALVILSRPPGQDAVSESHAGFSTDFELGFKEGYATYLFEGGSGNPPPVPPKCYWGRQFESAEGRQAIQEWFQGYRTGAALAQQSGYRELVILRSSTALPKRTAGPSPSPVPCPALLEETSPGLPKLEEVGPSPLPLPKTVPLVPPNPLGPEIPDRFKGKKGPGLEAEGSLLPVVWRAADTGPTLNRQPDSREENK